MVFLRGEVIAKADNTEQILYSDIGMFVFTHGLYSSLADFIC